MNIMNAHIWVAVDSVWCILTEAGRFTRFSSLVWLNSRLMTL